MSYKPRSLFRLIEEVDSSLFLPHIQRPFVWDEEQMCRLFDSLLQNYPIQTLLFWRTKDEIKARKFMRIVEWDSNLSDLYEPRVSKEGVTKTFVLDGQQRLQSLIAIYSGGIALPAGGTAEAFLKVTSGNDSDTRGMRYQLQFFAQSPGPEWYRVCDLLGRDAQRNAEEIGERLNDELDGAEGQLAPEHRPNQTERNLRQRTVRRNIGQLVSILREEKHFWVQELDGVANEYSYARVLEIFVRVNSGGTKLDSSDLMFAAMKEGWGEIEEAIEETTELLSGSKLEFDKTFPLKCLTLAHGRGAETSPEKFSGTDGSNLLEAMRTDWPRAEVAFSQLRDFMQQDLKIYSDKVIRTYNSFVPIFDFLFHNPSPNERSRALMRAYHYKAQLFGWYAKATDNVLNALHGFTGRSGLAVFPLSEIKNYFSGRGDTVDLSRSHLNESRLRFILLNLVYVDQMGTSPFDVRHKGNLPHVDHIYPQHALRTRLGCAGAEINHLGNFRFVGATDNIRKRAELPDSYFGRMKESNIDIGKHLLLDTESSNPSLLAFDKATYLGFRDRRFDRIWAISDRIVNAN